MENVITFLMDLISNGLFPIACCVGLIYIIIVLFKSYREDIQKLNIQHENETKDFTKALNQNTLALNKLCEKLDKGGKAND